MADTSFLLNGKEYTIYDKDFVIDATILDHELCNVGKTMVQYGFCEAELREDVAVMEANLARMEANLYAEIRAKAAIENEKMTEKRLEHLITQSPTYIEAVDCLRRSRKNHNMLRWAMNALDKRAQALNALAYRDRQLMKAEG